VLVPGTLLYVVPVSGLNASQQHLLAVFTATVIALVAQPVPMGVSTILAMVVLALTRTVPPDRVLSGYSNQSVWLIFSAFLFAGAVTRTGFGLRVAYLIVRRFGKSPVTIGWSIAATNLVLAPFIPSDTGRGGGIVAPVVSSIAGATRSVSGAAGAELGGFLTLVGFHSTYTTSAMFLTSMAANPLIANFAQQGAKVKLTWSLWALGACVPGVIALIVLPWCMLWLRPLSSRDTEPARIFARDALQKLGGLSRHELRLVVVLVLVLAGWITSPWHGISNTTVAMTGVAGLLIMQVITWDELLAEHRAFEALIWFGALIMMADSLLQAGVIDVLATGTFRHLAGWHGTVGLAVVVILYMYVHYGFASMTAQVTALYPSFLAAALVTGANPLICALSLGYFSSLDAALTHYGTGSAPVFFGNGYVTLGKCWTVGFLMSVVNVAIWLGLGTIWWKILGWW